MPNILLVEDDTALAELIASYLERNGYCVSVIAAATRCASVRGSIRRTW